MVRFARQREIRASAASLLFILWLSTACGTAADGPSSAGAKESVLTPKEESLVASVPYSSEPLLNRSGHFDTRFSVPPGTEWKEIYEKPKIISLTMAPAAENAQHYLSDGDVEGVFPVEAEYFFAALTNYGSYPRVSSRTLYDVGRGVGTDASYHKRIMKISGQFLGFGDTYLFVTNNYAMRLGKDAYGLKWNLEKSLDGRFYSLSGSWYLKSVECDGKPCTYVRYFAQTGFTRRPPVPAAILEYFTGKSFQSLLVEFSQEAAALQQAAAEKHTNVKTHDLLTKR